MFNDTSRVFLRIDPGYTFGGTTTSNCPGDPASTADSSLYEIVPTGGQLNTGGLPDPSVPIGNGLVGVLRGTILQPTSVDFTNHYQYTNDNSGAKSQQSTTIEGKITSGRTMISLSPLRINQGIDLISNGKINQFVQNAGGNAIAVAGRQTLVQTSIAVTGDNSNDSAALPVTLKINDSSGNTLQSLPALKAIGDYRPNGNLQWIVTMPDTPGPVEITAMVEPQDYLDVSGTDNTQTEGVQVQSLGRSILYKFLSWNPAPGGSWPLDNGADYGLKALVDTAFLHGAFPLPETGLLFETTLSSYTPSLTFPTQTQGSNGVVAQLQDIWMQTMIQGPPFPERVICLVPHSWFVTYAADPFAEGVGYGGLPIVFVDNKSNLSTSAHELGHTYGFEDLYKTADINGARIVTYNGPPSSPSGYWVQQETSIPELGFLDYMGSVPVGIFSPPARWTGDLEYGTLLQNFLGSTSDPEVLLVTGTVDANGLPAISKLYKADQGILSPGTAGDDEILLLDANNAVLASSKFLSHGSWFDSTLTPSSFPFAVALPYSAGAMRMEIRSAGKTMLSFNIGSKLLYDAISSIPDIGFDNNPAQRRNALLNKVTALDSQLTAGNFVGAKSDLQNDVRGRVTDWVLESYAITSPLQLSKQTVLSLIDELVQRLN
jgi:hypothetical protein